MNKLIKLDDLEYPVSIAEFERRHKNISFRAQIPFEDFGYAVVFPVAKPATSDLESAVEGAPNLTGLGTYEQTFTVVDIAIGMDQEQLDDLIAQLKTQKLADLESKAKEVALEDLTVGGVTFTTNAISISEITSSLSIMGRSPAEDIDFQSVGSWATANKASLEAMQDAIWTKKKATSANHKLHDDAINALATPQAVTAYDFSEGW